MEVDLRLRLISPNHHMLQNNFAAGRTH